MLVGEQLARAAEAALHLLGDEQRARLAADVGQAVQEVGRRDAHAAFALHGLDEHRRRLRPDERGRRLEVVPGAEAHAGDQGLEGRAVLLLPGHRRARPCVRPWKEPSKATSSVRPCAPPMRRANLIAASTASVPELQRKTLPGKASATRRSASVARRLVVVQVAGVDHAARLLADGGDDLGVAVAEAVHADAGREVEVGVARGVGEARPLAGHDHDVAVVDAEERAHAFTSAARAAVTVVPGKPPMSRALPATTTSSHPRRAPRPAPPAP